MPKLPPIPGLNPSVPVRPAPATSMEKVVVHPSMNNQPVSLDLVLDPRGGYQAGIGLRGKTEASIRMPMLKAQRELEAIKARYGRLIGLREVPPVFGSLKK